MLSLGSHLFIGSRSFQYYYISVLKSNKARIRLKIEIGLEFNQSEERKPISSFS